MHISCSIQQRLIRRLSFWFGSSNDKANAHINACANDSNDDDNDNDHELQPSRCSMPQHDYATLRMPQPCLTQGLDNDDDEDDEHDDDDDDV